jgi:hypothetical protein
MSERRAVVRSYQRLFVPDRRIYAVDGRTIPVPGGVPLRWLAHAAAVLAATLVVAGEHPVVIVGAGVCAYRWTARLGRRREGLRLAGLVAIGLAAAGLVVGVVDWPLRLVAWPMIAATASTQLAPDGRSVHRYLASLLWVRVAGRRRLARALPVAGHRRRLAPCVGVAGDEHRPWLGRARITGPCRVTLAEPVLVCRGRRRIVLRPVAGQRRRGGVMVDALHLTAGERAEVRP